VHEDVGSFWCTSNLSKMQAGVCELNQFSENMADSMVQVPRGEESCENLKFTIHVVPPPFSWLMTN
jgi:hypothetical protein